MSHVHPPTAPQLTLAVRLALLALPFVAAPISAQAPEHEGEIEGIVRDADGSAPLAGATVTLQGLGRATITHADGSFHFPGVATGVYTIRVERLGYRTVSVEVTAGPGTGFVIVELETSPLDVGGLVVTAALTERDASETIRPVSVVAGQELQRRLQSTVAATLSSEPGVVTTSMGPATARPVIRGMSGDRVLMLEDGARVGDVSGSGSDHASALDPSSARRIEVVRGPAALLYGSNALGGVVNVIRDEIPAGLPHHFTGSATLQSQTVSNGYAASASAEVGLTRRIPLRLEATGRTSGDLATPVGALENTEAETWSAGVGTSWVEGWGHVGAAFRAYQNDYGIPGGFVGGHADGVRIEMERTSTKLRTVVDRGVGPFRTLEADATHTWYRHSEIEPPDILGTFFKLQTVSGDVLARHDALGPFSAGAVGVRGSWEDFTFAGGLSTPDSRRYSAAAYVFEEIDLDPLRIETGLRYDWVRADPLDEDPDSDIGAIVDREFGSASASLGLLYDMGAGVTVGASVARAFRTPDISELYSEGPHLAAYSFEVGNPSLETEVGTGFDAFVRLGTERVSAELTGFYNDIDGYVYGEETGEISRVGLPVYQFQGNDAVLRGFEASVDASVVGGLALRGTASAVRGSLEATDEPLPLIPPLQGRVVAAYEHRAWFARAEAELASRQDRIGEFETPTDGYAVFHASAGLRLTVAGRLNVLTATLENVTDREYRNHLSRVKEIMPEAGRGLSLTYRVVF
jgi:iron complex outermembrane recepter protein